MIAPLAYIGFYLTVGAALIVAAATVALLGVAVGALVRNVNARE